MVSNHVVHSRLRDDVAAATMAKDEVANHGDTTEIVLILGVEVLEPLDKRGPEHVGIGVDVNIPVVVGTHAVRLLGDVDVFVLVEIPALILAYSQLVAALLIGLASLLAAVEIKVLVTFHGLGKNLVKTVPNVVVCNGLVEVGEDEVLGQALEHGHELRRDLVEGLGGARLHDDEDIARVGEGVADGVVRTVGNVLIRHIVLGEAVVLVARGRRRRRRTAIGTCTGGAAGRRRWAVAFEGVVVGAFYRPIAAESPRRNEKDDCGDRDEGENGEGATG